MADAPGGSTGPSKDDIKNAQSLKDEFVTLKDTIDSVGASIDASLTQKIRAFRAVAKKTAENTLKSLTAELNRASKGVDKTRTLSEDLSKKFISSKKIQESISVIKSRQSNIESTLLLLERQGVELSEKDLENIEAANQALKGQIGIEEDLLASALKREKAAGNIGKLFQGLTKIPILGSLIDAQAITEKINKTAANTGSKWKAFGAGISETFKSIRRSLTDPSTIILGIFGVLKSVYDLAVKFDQKTFDIAKNLGITVDEATILQKQFVGMANSNASFGLTASQIAKSYAEISNSLGFIAPTNKEFAQTATLIQRRLGASAEEMSALALQATLSGKTLEETLVTLNVSKNTEGARNKLLLSQKQILDGIAKTSASVLINFKGNVAELGNAIVRATKLGTTLDTINKQGETLLDFESSISAEFEAQLLTGRSINLTRAREYALMGKTAELGEELNRQGATYEQFMSENVIARQADAKAIGLSVEEYSKILLKQQLSNKLGVQEGQSLQDRYKDLMNTAEGQKIITQQLTEQERIDLRRVSIQDTFQSAMERLQDTIGQIVVGPMRHLLEDITNFLSKSENVQMIADGIKGLFRGIASAIRHLPQILGVAIEAMKILASITAVQAAAAVTAGSAYAGPAALGVGLATYAALTALMGGTGLGKFNFAGGGGEQESMTQPVNQAAAAATNQNTTALDAANMKAPIFEIKSTTYVGTEKWDSTTRTALDQSALTWA